LIPEQVLRYVNDLPRGSHVALFYENLDNKEEIIAEIVKDGLRKGETVVYLCRNVEQAKKFLARYGVDVDRCEKDGLIDIGKFGLEESHPLGIEFSHSDDNASVMWLKAYFKKKGNKPFRAVIDSLIDLTDLHHIVEIEKASEECFGRKASEKVPGKVVCVYSNKEIVKIDKESFFFDLIHAHSHAIFPGMAFEIK
jgi:KaiC/GvpD/RAD55 family RecA-like ATPase